jgi:hypothetical protein
MNITELNPKGLRLITNLNLFQKNWTVGRMRIKWLWIFPALGDLLTIHL